MSRGWFRVALNCNPYFPEFEVPKRTSPRVAEVVPGPAPFTLRIRWPDGGENVVDIAALVAMFRLYAPLRTGPALFACVRLGEHGTDVLWSDAIDMSAGTLWRLVDPTGQELKLRPGVHWPALDRLGSRVRRCYLYRACSGQSRPIAVEQYPFVRFWRFVRHRAHGGFPARSRDVLGIGRPRWNCSP